MKVIGQSLTEFRDNIDFFGNVNIGSSSSNKAELSYTLSGSDLSIFDIKTYSTSSAGDMGKIRFWVDEVFTAAFLDDGLNIAASGNLAFGGVDIIDDNSGTTTLKNIDAVDATTTATLSSALSVNTIKILPTHFMQNEDGGVNKSVQYDDTGTIGVRSSGGSDFGELYAFVEIPSGKTATNITIFGNDTGNTVEVFEANVNASGLTDRTPGGGCVVGSACDITDVAAGDFNYLAIKVNVTATSDIVYGGTVTLTDS